MKLVGKCRLVVSKNKAKGREYRKAIVNLPARILEFVEGGEEFHVFAGDGKIVLSRHENAVEEELLQKLVELFTLAFNDPSLGPQLLQKFPLQVGAIVNLLEKLKGGENE